MGVSNKYPTKPLGKRDYNSMLLSQISLDYIKLLSEQYGIQIEITFKPDGLRINAIKKDNDVIKKRTFKLDNCNLDNFLIELQRNISTLFC